MAKKKKAKDIELEEMNIFLKIPTAAAAITVEAILLDDDGKTQKVRKHLNIADIHTARQDFLDYVDGGDDYDAKFIITDEGRRYLEELESGRAGTTGRR